MRSFRHHFANWFFSTVAVTALAGAGTATNAAIDPELASRYFREASEICNHDGGKLWGVSLCGPMLFIDPTSRDIAANQPDLQAGLAQKAGVFFGSLPKEINIANTALLWAGVRWTMIVWPLPTDPALRAQLMMHELFHRIQDQLGLPASNPSNAHLDTLQGRIWLELEWRALARALYHSGSERRSAVEDALVFGAYRRTLFADATAEESELEMNEGLAEYTGVKLRGTSEPETISYLVQRLKSAESDPSFMRSFAYVSGPAEGILLDLVGIRWRHGLTPKEDLGTLLATAYNIALPPNIKEAVEVRSKEYGGDVLDATETAKDEARKKLIAQYRGLLVDGPVLVIPLRKMNIQFNPNNLVSLGSLGTVYPTLRITDEWGILTVSDGALMAPNWSRVTVAAPAQPTGSTLTGPGWTLDLKAGWQLTPGPRPRDLTLSQAN